MRLLSTDLGILDTVADDVQITYDSLEGNQQTIIDAFRTRSLPDAAEALGAEYDDSASVVALFEYPQHSFTAKISLTLPGKGQFDVEVSVSFSGDIERLKALAESAPFAYEVGVQLQEAAEAAGYRPTTVNVDSSSSGDGDLSHSSFDGEWSFHEAYR